MGSWMNRRLYVDGRTAGRTHNRIGHHRVVSGQLGRDYEFRETALPSGVQFGGCARVRSGTVVEFRQGMKLGRGMGGNRFQ